ncbi:MAG: nuclear transport factor 2 family protein [Chloroflexota bacterium]|nr:nuclear transport factor 2 family protein [Chloroflexota bacterium]
MTYEQAYALVERQARAWEAADVEAAVADFAPDAHFISPGGRWQGPDAIRGAVEAFFGGAGEVKVQITRVLVDGEQGAAEWTWSEVRYADGQRHTAEDAIVFAVREGKIVYWREYFDTANF